jgi:hypothetical protein
MKLKPYKEYLKMAKEAIDETLAPVRANKARKQAELEIAKLDEGIATKEAKISELCTEKDLNFSKIIDEQDSLALQVRRKKQFEKIVDELFPD